MTHALLVGGIKLLEGLFLAGLAGSAILIILTSVEDFREVLHREPPEESALGD